MEIERKFYTDKIPEEFCSNEVQQIIQYYISMNPDLRVRSIDDKEFYLTFKSETDDPAVRHEVEFPISENDFNHLKQRCMKSEKDYEIMVSKLRHNLRGYDHATYDEYLIPHLAGCWIEIEFSSKEEADSFTPPYWFGTEVTGDKFYRNANIAKSFRNFR